MENWKKCCDFSCEAGNGIYPVVCHVDKVAYANKAVVPQEALY